MSKKTRKKSGKPKLKGAKPKTAAGRKPKSKLAVSGTPRSKVAKKSSRNNRTSSKRASAVKASKTQKAENAPKSKRKTAALAAGDTAPAFQLPRDGGQSVALGDFTGRKLAIFFYPRADTPGCTREAMDFSRLAAAFAATGTAVLGVSADPVKAQESFRNKHQLSIPLLSDEKHAMLKAYGAWGEKSMYGKTFLGILRTTVLIGGNGKIAQVWRNVRVDGHADDVLAVAQALT